MGIKTMYTYQAHVTKVYDGDTITVDIDLGLNVWVRNEKVRLYGINAPEVRGKERPKGLLSRDHLRKLVMDKDIIIETIKDKKGKYGRYLGAIMLGKVNICQQMVTDGHAIYKEY